MIYKTGNMGKALREAYSSNKLASSRKMALGFFMGTLAFALFFMAQTMTESIFAESLPQIMQPSFFSTLTIYIHLVPVLYALYLLVYYDALLFGEIRHNSWYLLIKMDYRPAAMTRAKILSLFMSASFVYSLGFALTLFLTFFLKYSLITAYLPALYLAGLLDLWVIVSLALLISSLVKTTTYGRYLVLLSPIPLFILRSKMGFSAIISNRVIMQDIRNLVDQERSIYLFIALALILVSLLVSSLVARYRAGFYRLAKNHYQSVLPADQTLVRLNPKTGRKKILGDLKGQARRKKVLDALISFLLVVFILAALLFNAAILMLNATAKGKHVAIQGIIPYVFKTDTMAPEIKVNDLAFFKQYEDAQLLDVGEIILFDQDETMFVERIIKREGTTYTVDIDNYPPVPEHASMVKTVINEEIVGVYSGRSRWLGALILFANTIFGRISFLLIPAILLFFQRSLAGWKPFKKKEED